MWWETKWAHDNSQQEMFKNPPHAPKLAQHDYHLFLHPMKFLLVQILKSDLEKKKSCSGKDLPASFFFMKAYKNLVSWQDKFINLHGDCTEK
jgi:hypothetical protein